MVLDKDFIVSAKDSIKIMRYISFFLFLEENINLPRVLSLTTFDVFKYMFYLLSVIQSLQCGSFQNCF